MQFSQAKQSYLLKYLLPVLDFSTAADPQDRWCQWVRDRSIQLFDLQTRLFNSALIALAPDRSEARALTPQFSLFNLIAAVLSATSIGSAVALSWRLPPQPTVVRPPP